MQVHSANTLPVDPASVTVAPAVAAVVADERPFVGTQLDPYILLWVSMPSIG